jgi:hypothetical protein
MPTQELGRASLELSKHLGLRNGSHSLGFVGCGDDKLIVYVQVSERNWRVYKRPQPETWENYPVEYKFNVGPIVAFDD